MFIFLHFLVDDVIFFVVFGAIVSFDDGAVVAIIVFFMDFDEMVITVGAFALAVVDG